MKRVTHSDVGDIVEVTNFFDEFGEPTNDLWRAESCVIKLSKDKWLARKWVDTMLIYTVH